MVKGARLESVCAQAHAGSNPVLSAMKIATFAGGCFWCLQGPFDALDGVVQTEVGYTKDTDKIEIIQIE